MTEVTVKEKMKCPKCGKKLTFVDVYNRDNPGFYFRLSLIWISGSIFGCVATVITQILIS